MKIKKTSGVNFFPQSTNVIKNISKINGSNRCQPLEFRKLEFPFPKDASYQIWLKSVIISCFGEEVV